VGIGWEGYGGGLRVVNTYESRIFIKEIKGFQYGLWVTSEGVNGNSYNLYFIGHLHNNKKNLFINPTGGNSWCNENVFIGGRLSKLSNEIGNGSIVRIDALTKGSGYTSATVSITGGGGSGATASATIESGEITGYVITNGG